MAEQSRVAAGVASREGGVRGVAAFDMVVQSRLLLGFQYAVLFAMVATVATKVWQDHVWFGWALVGVATAAALPEFWSRRDRRWWMIYVAGIFVYTLLRSYADETAMPVRTAYAIDVDSWFFGGTDPVVRFQEAFFSATRVTALDIAAVAVHWSFFIAPHAGAAVIFFWRRSLFPRYAALVVGTMYLGLLLFFLVPTTPPWLAAQHGALPGAFRVMDFVGGRVDSGTYQSFYASLGEPNSVAAMPSIHLAVTLAMYLWARAHAPRFAWPLLVYTAVMGLALVYLAEHYVLDLAAGAACAIICFQVVWRLLPAREESGGLLVDAGAGRLETRLLRTHDHFAATDEEVAAGAEGA
jgi:membrane-associated phospholipid phosphatase